MGWMGMFRGIIVLAILAGSPGAQAAGDRVIPLEGGDRVVIRADGAMTHLAADGKPMAMPEGVAMITRDGHRIIMKNRSLWQEIVELAATSYARAQGAGFPGAAAGERVVELQDGGRIVVDRAGAMAHYDAAGNRQGMANGEPMTAKDGRVIMMDNGSLWTPAPAGMGGAGR